MNIPANGGWLHVSDDCPEIGAVVWLWDGRRMWIGGRDMADSETYLWANSHSVIWKNGKPDGDRKVDDEYKPTHWMRLPEPPTE